MAAHQIVTKARKAFDEDDFRWAAEILNHAVFADPDHSGARGLLADTYEQLGYGAENGTWRNFFMSGTAELRDGNFGTPTKTASADVIAQLTPEMLFDSLAIQINGPRAWDEQISVDVVLTDKLYRYRVWLSNGALIYTTAVRSTSADVTLTTTTRTLPAIAVSGLDPEALEEAGVEVTGDTAALERLAALLDPGDPNFNIVTP
ncbi:Alkyl/aryl-sulfatase, dimerization domain superfamily [Fusarium oxysporum f. sp. vasinfectum]|nr:Alkyl/aryl-sulfatase, dimerization domain superfamily [Fusarium oxysporum f. sp. vasinfectum]KAK2680458.1 Alkyl/aryl-sulfatase, dimerization domain superfamily [Fusarium oxysporum f. sp. vasinfectum]KAK2931589.1 Alkyl/aryl-sulfatase, dimerization domain superfamily [Fusarium oxysporum f. sp. vasinfectum]